jgi:hypothetical protein
MEDNSGSRRLLNLETQVSELLLQRVAADVNAIHDERLTPGDRMADSLADAVGSWRFIGSSFPAATAGKFVAQDPSALLVEIEGLELVRGNFKVDLASDGHPVVW